MSSTIFCKPAPDSADANEADTSEKPVIPRFPFMFTDPVKVCVSSEVSPNLVEPDSNMIDEDINSVLNSCAVSIPVTVRSPANVSVVFNRYVDDTDEDRLATVVTKDEDRLVSASV